MDGVGLNGRNVAVLGVGLLGLLGGCGSSPEGGGSTGSGATTTQQTTETSATSGSSTDAPPAEPPGLTEQGGILIGPESAPVTVTLLPRRSTLTHSLNRCG